MRFITMQHSDGTTSVWYEVNNAHPCPICGSQHKNQGWCLVKDDESMALCQRVSQGSKRQVGNYGHLHILRDTPGPHPHVTRAAVRRQRYEDTKMATEQVREHHERYKRHLSSLDLCLLAENLDVSGESIRLIRTGYKGDGWYTWPMFLAGQMVGIRYRHLDGSKLSLKGSRSGLIIPTNLRQRETLFVAEGVTDTAAALTIGLNVIGRPSCKGFEDEIARVVRSLNSSSVVVIRDMGRVDSETSQRNSWEGADRLAKHVARVCQTKLYTPPAPARDLREAVRNGLTAEKVYETLERDVKMEVRR